MIKLLENYRTISIMGAGKGVGKTYTLNHIISKMKRETCIGLTSIGLDASNEHEPYNTGSSGIYVKKGTCIASAEKCVLKSDVTREILDITGINTPLGRIAVYRALSDGHVEMGGPSICADLSEVHNILLNVGCERVFIDGALNRKTQSMPDIVDAIVLCTGASISPDMDKVIDITEYYVKILSAKKEENIKVLELAPQLLNNSKVSIIYADYSSKSFNISTSLNIDNEILESISKNPEDRPVWIVISGIVSASLLKNLLKSFIDLSGITILAEDGTKIFADNETLIRLSKKGGSIKVINSVKVACITVNPYSQEGYYFNNQLFIKGLKNKLEIPVFDLKEGK